jgi:hypothetical protein
MFVYESDGLDWAPFLLKDLGIFQKSIEYFLLVKPIA